MTTDLDQLAAAVAKRLRSSSPAGAPFRTEGPLSERGVSKHGRRWRVDTHLRGYRIREGGFATRQAAADWLYRLRSDPEALNKWLGDRLGPRDTVAAVLEHYMDARGNRLKVASRYARHAKHLERHMGNELAAKIRQEHVDRYLAAREGEGVKPKTVFNELSLLRTALRYAWRNDRLREAPRFKLSRPHCERDRVAWPDEAKRVIEAADPCLRRVLLAAYTMGLRRGEILEARWEWVQGDQLRLPETKNGRPKTVAIPPHLLAMLREPPVHWDRVFSRWGQDGKPGVWHVTTLQRVWTRLRKELGVMDLRLHDLRRSMSSVAQSRGHAAAAVQAVGGWVEPSTMQRHYSHSHQDQRDAVSQDLERLLVGNGQVDQQALTVEELLEAVELVRKQKRPQTPTLVSMSGGKK